MMKISYSGMSTYLDCPLQYKYRYVDKIYVVQDIRNQLVGLALHDVMNRWYLAGDFRKESAMSIAREVFDGYVAKNKVIWKKYENPEVVFLILQNQLEKTVDILIKANLIGQPLLSEISFEEPVGNLFIVKGRIDLYLDRGADSILLDFKTSKTKNYTTPDQLALYSYAMFRKFERHVSKCCYFFTSLGEMDWYKFSGEFYKKLFTKFKKVVDAIQGEQFQPMPTKKTCGWCAYNATCPHNIADISKD